MKSLFWKFFWVLLFALIIDVTIVGLTIELVNRGHLPMLTDFIPSDCEELVQHHRPSPLLPITIGTITSLIFGALLAWYFTKPIHTLRTAFAVLGQGNLDIRVAPSMGNRHDELADLGLDFDKMATQIGSLVNAQQRLLHDVSHELRSPLARMQAAIGIAQQQPEETPDNLKRIEMESQRISDLIGELLVLSRLEAGVADRQVDDIDIASLLEDIVENGRFEANQKQVDIEYPGIEAIILPGYGELVYRAVENILRNAIQHSKPEDKISVSACYDDTEKYLHISIDDQGPGVEEKYLQDIFQPFFRHKQSKKADGVGLGLTIAQRAVAAHGGKILAKNRPEGGLHVRISIPFFNLVS
jgi:two-component system, OmpR family, sensor kinase